MPNKWPINIGQKYSGTHYQPEPSEAKVPNEEERVEAAPTKFWAHMAAGPEQSPAESQQYKGVTQRC